MQMEELLKRDPYADGHDEKQNILLNRVNELNRLHYSNCDEYRRFIDTLHGGRLQYDSLSDVPFLPVKLFKKRELKSVNDNEIFKVMTSSGTSGQQVSRIILDKATAGYQQKVLAKLVTGYTGQARMPMIILDCPSVLKNRSMFSARGAGILGFSLFGSKKIYAFNDNMELDIEGIREFIKQNGERTIFLFGFTYMIWEYFYKKLSLSGEYLNLENAVLIHGGGWKKLVNEAVSRESFKECLNSVCGITSVHDYYGMVEQTGCIYMECEYGHLHASLFSDVIVRDMKDFSECEIGKQGAIQVLSAIPQSYPGHSILTEDIGCILGEDDCPCGRKGKYINISGRMKNAEVRGCSDTFER